jgi:hypothetical protein
VCSWALSQPLRDSSAALHRSELIWIWVKRAVSGTYLSVTKLSDKLIIIIITGWSNLAVVSISTSFPHETLEFLLSSCVGSNGEWYELVFS